MQLQKYFKFIVQGVGQVMRTLKMCFNFTFTIEKSPPSCFLFSPKKLKGTKELACAIPINITLKGCRTS